MDPPYVVTLPVFAYERVILADHAPTQCGQSSLAGNTTTNRLDRRQRHDPRSHHDLAGGDELPIQLHQTKRINSSYGQRAVEKRPRTRPSKGYSTTRRQV